ncbi:hypothetical protein D3P07_04355 [Paenibacillus sp. 1011MAR3C5]|uniref:RHS repeat domain-containing protein n=1 Tax=Paenibacillus sp. 1011MAR3C5 TaxID=1675787 RepID=UPI000E6CCFDA|nr:hypothetical protein [Paenibacillus sp. 1011MAR3C5]RJE91292.1 hypothetical protein D3P07_04355 [Paenibacillus sp. 1011MAR3C5]
MFKRKQRASFTGVSKKKIVILIMIIFLFTSYFQSSQSIAISENMKGIESASEVKTIKTASIQGKESAKKMDVEQLRAESIEKSLQMLKQEDKKKYFPNKTLVQNKQVEKYIITISDSRDFLISAIDWSLENQIKVLELPTIKDDFSAKERKAMSVASEKGLLFISSDIIVEKNELGKAITINKDDLAQKVSEKALIKSYSVEKDKVVSRKYNLVDGTSSLDVILMMLSMNLNMNQLQLNNLLEVTSNPIGNIENNEYEVNTSRILEFMLLMKNAPKQSIESNMPSQSLVTTTNATLPSISASNITTNSITWNVAYINPNAYGNRLELYNFTTNQWTDISGTYYTKNGSYTASNLSIGNTYRGRLTYFQNDVWIVVDKIVTTIATGQPTINVSNVQSTFAGVNVKYPANVVYGNKLELYHYASGQWTTIVSDKAANGTYTINNLIPGNYYFVRMTWYDNDWKIKDVNFTTSSNNQLLSIKYEYDSNGRLIYIKDSQNNIIASFTYDDNGNMKSVQK